MAKRNGTSALVRDGQAILGKGIMVTPVDDMSVEQVHYAWSVLDLFEKALKQRKGEFRERLLGEAEEHGKVTPKGHYVLDLGNGKVTRQRRQGSDQVDEQALMDLLRDKGIDLDQAFNRRTVYELDDRKLATLMATGDITEDEAAQVITPGRVTWALRVDRPADLPATLLPGSTERPRAGTSKRPRALKSR